MNFSLPTENGYFMYSKSGCKFCKMAKELLPDVTVVRDRDHKTISGGSIATVYRYARFGYVCQLFDFLNQILSQLLFAKFEISFAHISKVTLCLHGTNYILQRLVMLMLSKKKKN